MISRTLQDDEWSAEALSLWKQGHPADAIKVLNKALQSQHSQNQADYHWLRGEISHQLGWKSNLLSDSVAYYVSSLNDCHMVATLDADSFTGNGFLWPTRFWAIPAYITLLDRQNEEVQRKAAYALGAIGPIAAEAVDALELKLLELGCQANDSSAQFNSSIQILTGTVRQALNQIVGNESVQARDDSPRSRYLSEINSALDDFSWNSSAVEGVAREPGPSNPLPIEQLADPDDYVRARAAAQLILLNNDIELTIARLLPMTHDKKTVVRTMAVYGLGGLGLGVSSETPSPASRAAIIAALLKLREEDRSYRVRAACVQLIGKIGCLSEHRQEVMVFMDELVKGLKDSHANVRIDSMKGMSRLACTHSVKDIVTEAIIAEVISMLHDADDVVRRFAIYALAEFGRFSPDIVSAIEKCTLTGGLFKYSEECVKAEALLKCGDPKDRLVHANMLARIARTNTVIAERLHCIEVLDKHWHSDDLLVRLLVERTYMDPSHEVARLCRRKLQTHVHSGDRGIANALALPI